MYIWGKVNTSSDWFRINKRTVNTKQMIIKQGNNVCDKNIVIGDGDDDL